MPPFWANRKVLVTGGAGFVGSHLADRLLSLGAQVTVPVRDPSKKTFLELGRPGLKLVPGNLEDPDFCRRTFPGHDTVFHAAASVGGIHFNMAHHGSIFKDNMAIATNVLEAARAASVERTVVVSSACVYPRHAAIPTPEEDGFKDEPEPTNAGYGWAKRMVEFMARSYAQEFGMKVAIARPCNVYGPRDNFDPGKSHVIAALIERAFKKPDPFTVWGSGKQTRSFIYVEDLIQGLLAVAEKCPPADPVNLCSSEEVAVKDLVLLVLKAVGYSPRIELDTSKPDGYPRRLYDHRKAERLLGFKAATPLAEGIRKTVDWYRRTVAK